MTALRAARSIAASAATAGVLVGGTQLVVASVAQAKPTSLKTTTAVNVRSGPGTSSPILGSLPAGATVTTRGSARNGWMPVTWQGRSAWIASPYLTAARRSSAPTAAASTATTMATAISAVNVRTGPSTTYPKVRVLQRGGTVRVTGRTYGPWTQAVLDGRTVWIYSSYLAKGRVQTDNPRLPRVVRKARATTALMLRTHAGPRFRSTGDVPAGTILNLTGVRRAGVEQVVYQGAVRWVNANFLAPVGSSPVARAPRAPRTIGTLYATTALNLWTASSGPAYVGEIPKGTKLAITGTVRASRAQVVHQGTSRWVTARYLSSTRPGVPSRSIVRGPGGSLDTGGSVGLDRLTPSAKGIVHLTRATFPQITTMYGWRQDPLPDHPSGRAVDLMIPSYRANNALGWQIAYYLQAHARELNVQYVIWDQKIWSVARANEGWRPMADRGGDTANHRDHVHVTVN